MPWFPFWKKKKPDTSAGSEQSIEVLLNGRRYRQDVPYVLPKDLGEVNRLDFQHYLVRQALKINYVAPLTAKPPGKILDVGCGTGRWAREVSIEFPHAYVTGIDIEMPHLATETNPTNCHYVQGNVLKGLPFTDNTFDFVHQRFLASAIPADKWPALIKELVRVTAPGGWIELTEMLHRVEPMQAAGQQMARWIEQFCTARNIYPAIGESLGTLLEDETSLTDKQIYFHDLPVGEWGGRDGKLLAQSHLTAYAAIKPIYVKELHVEPAAFDWVIDKIGNEWEESHAHSRCYFSLSRKV
jgi:ubiquinone/menaquinone biosynthesis C-methylase UbiE